jgi:sec-independent protein translocase protein TatA
MDGTKPASSVLSKRLNFLEKPMGIGIWELLLLFLIVVLLFGTKKLRNIGGDLGSAIRSFRGAMQEGDEATPGQTINAEAVSEKNGSAG